MSRYEFVVLRYIHDLSAGEAANIGIVLFDAPGRRIHVILSKRYRRLTSFFGSLDPAKYRGMVSQVKNALERLNDGLEVSEGELSLAELLTDVLPGGEASLQASSVGSGIADHPRHRAEELFEELVESQGPSSDLEHWESEYLSYRAHQELSYVVPSRVVERLGRPRRAGQEPTAQIESFAVRIAV